MLLVAVVTSLLSATGPEASLEVSAELACATSALEEHLRAAGVRVGPTAAMRVGVRVAADEVVVTATRGSSTLRRAFRREPDCAAVARVLAMLISAWAREPTGAVEAPAQKPTRAPAARSLSAAPTPAAATPPEPEAPESAPPPRAPESPRVQPRDPPARREPSPELRRLPERPEPEPERDWSGELALLGGGGLGSEQLAAAGELRLGLSWRAWGVVIDGGLASARGTARIEVASQWLSLSARATVAPHPRLRLDLTLGPRLWRLAGQGLALAQSSPVVLSAWGAVASGGISFRASGPLWVELRGFVSARLRSEVFRVQGLAEQLALAPWEGGVLLGLRLQGGPW